MPPLTLSPAPSSPNSSSSTSMSYARHDPGHILPLCRLHPAPLPQGNNTRFALDDVRRELTKMHRFCVLHRSELMRYSGVSTIARPPPARLSRYPELYTAVCPPSLISQTVVDRAYTSRLSRGVPRLWFQPAPHAPSSLPSSPTHRRARRRA